MRSCCFSRTLPNAIASITHKAKPQRARILASPRMVCRSNPNETSKRLFTLSTAVLYWYSFAHL